jgi:hypothetical protein
VRSIKCEGLSKLILFGEASLRRAITQFLAPITMNEITKAKLIFYSSLQTSVCRMTRPKYVVGSL